MPTILFSDDGDVEFTREPNMLALFEGEQLSIKRMSDIVWSDDHQKYYIRMMLGPFAPGQIVGPALKVWRDFRAGWAYMFADWGLTVVDNKPGRQALFPTYEQAVACEIEFCDMLRQMGYSLHG